MNSFCDAFHRIIFLNMCCKLTLLYQRCKCCYHSYRLRVITFSNFGFGVYQLSWISYSLFSFNDSRLPWMAVPRNPTVQCHYQPFVTMVHTVAGSQSCILIYSMVQSPSWAANWFAASQEIPRISRNPKVHYRTHKRPPPVSTWASPIQSIYPPTSHLPEIHPDIIHPSRPRSPQWSLSLRFPHQDPIHPLSSPIRATCPAHLILLYFITRTILGEQYKSFSSSLCSLLYSPVTSSLLGPNILLNTLFSNTLGFLSSLNVSDQVSHP